MIQQTIFPFKLEIAREKINNPEASGRLVIKRKLRKQKNLFEWEKYFYHVVATNWNKQEKNAHEALQSHNQRGEAENFNKELKNGFGMEGNTDI